MSQEELGFYQSQKVERQEQKAATLEENMKVFQDCEYPFETRNNGTVVLFRVPGKPYVDFYPTTNRWHALIAGERLRMNGNAKKFLKWFAEQFVTDRFQKPKPKLDTDIVKKYSDWNEVKADAIRLKKVISVFEGGWILK